MTAYRCIVAPREIPQYETNVEAPDEDTARIAAIQAYGTTETHQLVSIEALPAEAVSVPQIEPLEGTPSSDAAEVPAGS